MLLIARCPAGVGAAMIPVPPGVRFWLAFGRVDMRRGMNGLALRVQETLRRRALSRVLILAVPNQVVRSVFTSPERSTFEPATRLVSRKLLI